MSATIAESRPIIVLGWGGSGTRVLSAIARASGVFLGSEINATGDSVEWVELIYATALARLLTGAPPPPDTTGRLHARAAEILTRARRVPDAPWGWKLPETMLVLGPVLSAFPHARLAHLVRHPVSASLRRAHPTARRDTLLGRIALPAAYRAHGLDASAADRDPPPIHNALSWDLHVRAALAALEDRPAATDLLQLRFEELISDPDGTVAAFRRFVGLSGPGGAPAPRLDPARAGTRSDNDERLAERIWAICGETATRLGYAYGSFRSLT